jgi:hypothetical protein
MTNTTTVPTGWVKVPKADCSGPLPWYKSVLGGADTTEEIPGYLVMAGTGTESVHVELEGLFEFKTAVATGNTPVEVALRSKLREQRAQAAAVVARRRLLAVLGTPDLPPPTSVEFGKIIVKS